MTKPCQAAPAPTAPTFKLPAGATDSHLHVLGPYARYPLAADRNYTAPEATVPMLREYMRVTGLARVVIAHVSAHGADMAVTLDAIRELGDCARGTAMLKQDATKAEVAALHAAGMRGVRLSDAFGYPVTQATIAWAGKLVAPFGWHIAIWPASAGELDIIEQSFSAHDAPVVVDHLAHHTWNRANGLDDPGFRKLLRLLKSGRLWLKLSAAYRASSEVYPWPELAPFCRALVAEVPERLLWASDWPHVGHWGPMPQSGEMLDWLVTLGCDEALLKRILVDNPAKLYGY